MCTDNPRIVLVQSEFPSISATFILSEIAGLMERGFDVVNWATCKPAGEVVPRDVELYGLMDKTRYLKLPPPALQKDDDAWLQAFFHLNTNLELDRIAAFHVHYGENFNRLKPLFGLLDNYLVVSFHGPDLSRTFRNECDACYEALFERADRITAPSYAVKRELVRRGCTSGKIRVHRNGIDLRRHNRDKVWYDTENKSTGNSEVRLLTVGHLVEKTGIGDALKAFAGLPETVRSRARYHIVGEGPLKKELADLAERLKIADKVVFKGVKPGDQVVSEMAEADIFVLTSVTATDGDMEGLPVSLVEAQVMGLPVISYRHWGIGELVKDGITGLLVDEHDIDGIARNMERLISERDLRRELSAKALERIPREYDLERLNDSLARLIIEGIRSKKTGMDPESLVRFREDDQQVINEDDPLGVALREKEWTDKLELYQPCFESVRFSNRVDSPRISIIIIAWRMLPEILENLHTLVQQRNQRPELIFVDNGSEHGEFSEVAEYVDVMVRLNRNTGAYLARNIGAVFSRASILLFLDDDALPDPSLVRAHINTFQEYEVIAVRGAVLPRTGNPLNQIPGHYNLGDTPYPVYANVEGNVSYDTGQFFTVGGWDDEIRFGGGGADLSARLFSVDPDMRKQIYVPDAVIYHDFVDDKNHLKNKQEKQEKSRERLHDKHPDWDDFMLKWKALEKREDLLIRRGSRQEQNWGSAENNGETTMESGRPGDPEYCEEQASDHVYRASKALQCRKNREGIHELELALELCPTFMKTVFMLRHVEITAGEEYRRLREARELAALRAAWGTDRWSHVLLKQAAFDNAPKVMDWIREKVKSDGLESESLTEAISNDRSSPPRISFIIPVYNRPVSIRKTCESVLNQSVPDWEAILVDDASTDNTPEIIESIREENPEHRIRSVLLKENRGIGAVRNIGVREAKGEFVVLLDSDDTIAPKFLDKTLTAADDDPEAAWISTLTVQQGEVNRLFGFELYSFKTLLQRNQFNITCLLRREVFEAVGGMREEMRDGLVDWDFWIRAAIKGYRPAQLKEVLFFYNRHPGGVSGGLQIDSERLFRCHRQIVEFNSEIYRPLSRAETVLLTESPHIPQELIDSRALKRLEECPNPLAAGTGKDQPEARSGQSMTGEVLSTSPQFAGTTGYKILFVCHDFPPYRFAGAQLYALYLARELISNGHDVRVLHPVDRSKLNGLSVDLYELVEGSYAGVPIYRLVVDDTNPDIRINPQYVFDNGNVNRAFERLLVQEGFDLVHFHLLYRLGGGLPGVTGKLEVPSIATLHDYWLLCAMGHMINSQGEECSGPDSAEKCAACLAGTSDISPPQHLVEFTRNRLLSNRKAYQLIDRVLAPSGFIAGTHHSFNFPMPEVRPLGWLPVEVKTRRTGGDRIVFGYCGQIVYRKGLDILLRAVSELDRDGWELQVYGSRYQPSYFDAMMKMIESHPNISYMDEFTPEELSEIYSRLDVVVLPSRRENYPLSLLEALSARVPVIASRVGGVQEMMEQESDGFMFENGDHVRLREIIENLLRNPQVVERVRGTIREVKTIREDALEMARIYSEVRKNPARFKPEEKRYVSPVKGPG